VSADADFLRAAVRQAPVVVVGRDGCELARGLLSLLNRMPVSYTYVRFDGDPEMFAFVAERTGGLALPAVFVDGVAIPRQPLAIGAFLAVIDYLERQEIDLSATPGRVGGL
jgi:hypothetical protein